MKRLNLSALLAHILVLCTLLAACASPQGATDGDDTAADGGDPSAETETDDWGRQVVPDKLDGLTFDGETVTFLLRNSELSDFEIEVEAPNGEVINDALYNRNITVEDRLDVKFGIEKSDGSWDGRDKYIKYIQQSAIAGDNAFDIVTSYAYYGTTVGLIECFYNLLDLPHTDFTKPWWNTAYIEAATLYDQCYYAIGDLSLSSIERAMVIFFNKNQTASYFPGVNVYDYVFDGTWTIDRLTEMVKGLYSDLNGNGKKDFDDFYGLITYAPSETFDGYSAAFQLDMIAKGEDGEPVITINNEKTISAIDKLLKLYIDNPDVKDIDVNYNTHPKFARGEAVFLSDMIMRAEDADVRNMTEAYGILPLPKYDDKQDGYGTLAQDAYNIYSVMGTIRNPDAVGAVLEAMSAESYRQVTPVYCEVAMKIKYLNDEESVAIFDTILKSLRSTFANINSINISDIGNTVRNVVYDNRTNNFTSRYASQKSSMETNLATLLEAYADRQG